MRIAVSCIAKFHAFNLAEQLNKHGVLSRFYTSYAYQRNRVARLFTSRKDNEQIEADLISTNTYIAALTRLNGPSFANVEKFDHWVKRSLSRADPPDVFIGWSGMSLHSIEAARARGVVTILERGSCHMLTQMNLLQEEYERNSLPFEQNEALLAKELAEYEAADYVSVPSSFALDSFLANGVAKEKMLLNTYGASNHFRASSDTLPNTRTFRILYLGAVAIPKGIMYLLDALDQLSIDYEVDFVGVIRPEMQHIVNRRKKSNWVFHGHVNHYALQPLIAQCHVAVQPSIQEGLSMVIPQILSAGVPVIATENTGARSLKLHSQKLKIIPIRDSNAIHEAIMFYFNNETLLQTIRKEALLENSVRSWDEYGSDYMDNLSQLL